MGWLVNYTLASLAIAFIAWRVVDYLWSSVSSLASAAKTGIFVGVWTAVTTGLGMRKFTEWVRGLRKANRRVVKH